ncbi:MAG: tetratricopeptide repeat protein [bacterium]|nr:tetratricopeptide repeat protein [bacterium]
MQSKVKLTKRQIKEDKFTTFMLNARSQFQDKWQFYVAGIAAVILVFAAINWYVSDQQTQQADAEAKFARAVLDYQSGDNQIALLGFDQLLNEYGSTDVAEQATYLLGKIHLANKNYEDAVRYFEIYLDRYRNDQLNRAAAQAGVASAREDLGSYAEAAAAFAAAAEMHPEGPLAADYEYGALRNYILAGDLESAGVHHELILEKHANTVPGRSAIRLFSEKGQS